MSEASREGGVHTHSYSQPKKETLNSLLASANVNENSVIKALFLKISHIEKVQSEVISKQRDAIKELEESESVEIGDLSRELKKSRQELLSILKTQGQYLHNISTNMQSKFSSTSYNEATDLPDPRYFYEDDNPCVLKGRGYNKMIIDLKNQLKIQMRIISKQMESLDTKDDRILYYNENISKNMSREDPYLVPSINFVYDSSPHDMMEIWERGVLQSHFDGFASPAKLIKQIEDIHTLSAKVGKQKENSPYDLNRLRRDLGQSTLNTKSFSYSAQIPSDLFEKVESQSEELCKSIQMQIEIMRKDLQALAVQMSHLQASKTLQISSSSHNEALNNSGTHSTSVGDKEFIEWNEFQSCLSESVKVSDRKIQGKSKPLEQITNETFTYIQNDVSKMYPRDQRLEIEPLCSKTNNTSLDFCDRRRKKKSWIKKKLKRMKKRQRTPKVGEIYDAVTNIF
ncbi:predicted protein [Chaetoceros tenuissimus]|uniref:Uncharacterized protein n=1 Tax=Chaetoceros tenuissimus TaxID=426638 RepID=A0AAD3CWD2_9STRA|nr:predicted protein [Chaetoceros tenuissimus]